MSSDGTVAPKERVNIVYKADVGGMQEEVELPLRLLVVGDFSGREGEEAEDKKARLEAGKEALPAVEKRDVTSVDKDNFQQVLEGHDLTLRLDVDDLISGKGGKFFPELRIKNMDDFEPDNIVEAVPALKELMEMRKALIELKGPLDQYDDLRARLQQMLESEEEHKGILESFEVGQPGESK